MGCKRRKARNMRTSKNFLKANFHEKALFVRADVADPFVVERNGSASFATLPFALSMSPRSSVTRCIVRSIFSDYQEGAAIFGSVSPAPRGGWTKFATCAAALSRSEAIGQEKPCVSL